MAPRKRLALHIVALLLLLPGAALPAPTNLYAFGDSLLDSGNAYAITGNAYPISPPYAQRFSNGPVASEVLASNLGVTAIASQLGGTNYATGGATSGIFNFAGIVYGSLTLPPPFTALPSQIALLSSSSTGGLTQQVGPFASAPPADIGSSLALVWAGGNDVFLTSALVANGMLPPGQGTFIQAANAAATNVENAIRSLADAGAKNILAIDLPDLGRIPAAASNPFKDLWSAYTNQFNEQFLDPAFLAGLDPTVKLTEFSMFDLLNSVISDPSAYGLDNVTEACLPTSGPVPIDLPCAEPDKYLFWDGVHPTTAAAQIIGNRFYAAIPEPPSLALLMAAFVLLIARRIQLGVERVRP